MLCQNQLEGNRASPHHSIHPLSREGARGPLQDMWTSQALDFYLSLLQHFCGLWGWSMGCTEYPRGQWETYILSGFECHAEAWACIWACAEDHRK